MSLLSTLANSSVNFLRTIPRELGWFSKTAPARQVFLGATYSDLSDGNYFTFGDDSTGAVTNSYNYSNNGVDWTTGALPTSGISFGVAGSSGSSILLCSTDFNLTGTLLYTTNGTTWTSRSVSFGGSTNISIRDCIWDGTRYIVSTTSTASYSLLFTVDNSSLSSIDINGSQTVGYSGAGTYISLVFSDTGTSTAYRCTSDPTTQANWSTFTLPATARWRSIKYGNGIWVAVAHNTTTYVTSPDGITWTSRTLPAILTESTTNAADNKIKIGFGKGKFWAYKTDNLYSSTDGINWTTEKTFATSTLDVATGWAIGPDKVLGVGYDSSSAGTSTYILGEFYDSLYLSWDKTAAPSNNLMRSVEYADLSGSPKFLLLSFSADSTSAGTAYYYSTDGAGGTWTSASMPSSAPWTKFIANNDGSRVLAIAGTTGTGGIASDSAAYTSNGTTWTSATLPSSASWTGRFLGDKYVLTNRNSSDNVAWSTTGETGSWTTLTPAGVTSLRGVAYNGTDRHIIAANSSSVCYYYNSDFTSGGNAALPSVQLWTDVAYGNGIWVIVAAGTTTYATSTNGTTWTSRTLPYTPNGNLANIVFSEKDGKFIVLSNGSYYMTSTDGINWTSTYLSAFNAVLRGYATDGTNELFVSSDGIAALNYYYRSKYVY